MILTFSRLTCGELPSQRLRALTLGLAFSFASFGEWVSGFIAPVSEFSCLPQLGPNEARSVLTAQYFLNPDALGWNAKFAYLWAPACVLGAIWVYFYLPEVKDRRLEEIDEMVRALNTAEPLQIDGCRSPSHASDQLLTPAQFLARLPAKKFRQYECTGIGALVVENESSTSISNVTDKKDEVMAITRTVSNPV